MTLRRFLFYATSCWVVVFIYVSFTVLGWVDSVMCIFVVVVVLCGSGWAGCGVSKLLVGRAQPCSCLMKSNSV